MTTGEHLPAIRQPGDLARSLTPISAFRNARAVQGHLRRAVYLAEVEMIDLAASTEVALAQLQAEMALYRDATRMADGDPGLQELAARKLAHFCESNNMRLVWRYR